MEEQRTPQQNRALHLFLSRLSDELNAAGYTVKKTLRPSWDVNWNEKLAKELIWRPIQKMMTGKESTTELNTSDIDKIYEVININLGEKTGVHVPFPSNEEMMNQP